MTIENSKITTELYADIASTTNITNTIFDEVEITLYKYRHLQNNTDWANGFVPLNMINCTFYNSS